MSIWYLKQLVIIRNQSIHHLEVSNYTAPHHIKNLLQLDRVKLKDRTQNQ